MTVAAIQSFIDDQAAGLKINPDDLDIGEFELLKIWRMQEQFHKRKHRANLHALVESMGKM